MGATCVEGFSQLQKAPASTQVGLTCDAFDHRRISRFDDLQIEIGQRLFRPHRNLAGGDEDARIVRADTAEGSNRVTQLLRIVDVIGGIDDHDAAVFQHHNGQALQVDADSIVPNSQGSGA